MRSAEGVRAEATGAPAAARRRAELSRHALRTPLLAIRGTAELLLSGAGGPLGPTARELLAASGEAALRLERLVEPILRLAERAGGPRAPLEPVDPVALLRAAGIEAVATAGRRDGSRGGARGGTGPPLVRARRACLAELFDFAAGIAGAPLEAELRWGRRSRAVLLRLEGRGPEPCTEDERPLLFGLAQRLARLAGARLVAAGPGRLGIVLPPAVPASRGSRRCTARCGSEATP